MTESRKTSRGGRRRQVLPGQIVSVRVHERLIAGRVLKVTEFPSGREVVDFEEFGTGHRRTFLAEVVTIRRRTAEKDGPAELNTTPWGEKERAHDLLVEANRPAMRPRPRRRA